MAQKLQRGKRYTRSGARVQAQQTAAVAAPEIIEIPDEAGLPKWISASLDYLALAIFWVFLCVSLVHPIRDTDVWWHLKTGQVMWESHFPSLDEFTWTVTGRPYVNHSWLSDIFYYLFWKFGGPAGVIAFRFVAYNIIFGIVALTIRGAGIPWAAVSIVLFTVHSIINGRFLDRPHIFSYLLYVTVLYLLVNAGKFKRPWFWALPFVQALWANMHGSVVQGGLAIGAFIVGDWIQNWLSGLHERTINLWYRLLNLHLISWLVAYAVYKASVEFVYVLLAFCAVNGFLFLYYLWNSDHFEDGLPTFTQVPWFNVKTGALLLGLSAFGSFLSRNGLALYQDMIFESTQKNLVMGNTTEWFSPFNRFFIGSGFFYYYLGLLLGASLCFFMAQKKFRLGTFYLVMATLYLSLQAHRFRVECTLAIACVCAPLLWDIMLRLGGFLQNKLKESRGLASWWRPSARAAALAICLVMLLNNDRTIAKVGIGIDDTLPQGAVDFMEHTKLQGYMWNDLMFGGYFLWFTDRKVYLDGRNFDSELYQDFLDMIRAEPNWETLANKKWDGRGGVDFMVLRYPLNRNDSMIAFIETLSNSPNWRLAFFDDVTLLFVANRAPYLDYLQKYGLQYAHPYLNLGRVPNDASIQQQLSVELERLVSDSPTHRRALRMLVELLRRMQDWPRAEKYWRQMTEEEHEETQAYLGLAQALASQNKMEEAGQALNRAPEGGFSPEITLYRAGLLFQTGKRDEADKAYREAAARMPDNPQVLTEFVRYLVEVNNRDEALRVLDGAVGRGVQSAEVYTTLGSLHYDRRSYPEAREAFESATRVDPNSAASWRGLGEACLATGDKGCALNAFQRAQQIQPGVPEVMKRINELTP